MPVVDPATFRARAFTWILDHLEAFDPFARQRRYEIRAGQRVGELAILLKTHVGLTGDRDSDGVKRILALLERLPAEPGFADRLIRYPGELILFAQLVACLRFLGVADRGQRAALERALDARYLGHTERLPHRMMDVASCLEGGGFATRFPSLEALYRGSILSPVPQPVHLNEDAVYAITHVIMFLYDFGLRDGPEVPSAERAAVGECLSALLVAACREHHWDLLAELLVCWDCIGLEHGFIYRGAWEALIAVQRSDGAVPGPEWASKQHAAGAAAEPPAAGAEFDIAHHYHTTLVAVIAGLLREKRAAAPRASRALAMPRLRPDRAAPRYEEAIDHAGPWLHRSFERVAAAERVQPKVLCRLLLGSWICLSAGPAAASDIALMVETMVERLPAADAPVTEQWSRTPPVLQLLTAAILEASGVVVPYLHGRDGLARRAAAALAEPEAAASDDPALHGARLILHSLVLGPAPAPLPLELALDAARQLPLAAEDGEVEASLALIEAATGQGTRRVAIGKDQTWLADLLAGLAVAALRKYDLVLGCRILRAMNYLRLAHPQREACLDFLLLQQQPGGAFGRFGPEASLLPADYPVTTALELPVTIDCLWTLAEARGDWRLYRSFTRAPTPAAALATPEARRLVAWGSALGLWLVNGPRTPQGGARRFSAPVG